MIFAMELRTGLSLRERAIIKNRQRSLSEVLEYLLTEEFQYFRRMRAGISDRNPMLLDRAIGADQSRRANRPFRDFARGIFARSPGAIGLHGFFLLVGEQNKWKVELANELIMRIDAIRADTHDHGIGFRHGYR